MNTILRNTLVGTIVLAVTATLAADPIEIRLNDGSRWRGESDDFVSMTVIQQGVKITLKGRIVEAAKWHITLMTDVAGEIKRKTIFKDDILAVSTLDSAQPVATVDRKTRRSATTTRSSRRAAPAEVVNDSDRIGVFVLPLKEMVGLHFRHEEIEAIGEEADQYGPGQIIILKIDSGGGSVVEMEKIHETLTDLKKRHRVIAWIDKAISAACATALHCNEIYFDDGATAGAMTAFNSATMKSLQDEQLEKWLQLAGDWAEDGGRTRYIAEAMIDEALLLSYDKDPKTGEVTFYNDLSGEHILSRAGENLVFNSKTALACGFADGIARNEEELAEHLDLPEWYEISDYGRQISQEWIDTVDRAQRELDLLYNRLSYAGTGSGDTAVVLGKRIQILQKVLRWDKRAPNATAMKGIIAEDLEKEIIQLRKQLADLKRR